MNTYKWKQFLYENKETYDSIAKKYPELHEKGILKWLSDHDPSGRQTNGEQKDTYLYWTSAQYKAFDGVIEPPGGETLSYYIIEILKLFLNNKQRIQDKNINNYDLKKMIDVVSELGQSKTKQNAEKKMSGAVVVSENDKVKILHIKTKEAACEYGSGSKWCTAGSSNNLFDTYNNDQKIFIIFYKELKYHNGTSEQQYKEQPGIERDSGAITEWKNPSQTINFGLKELYKKHGKDTTLFVLNSLQDYCKKPIYFGSDDDNKLPDPPSNKLNWFSNIKVIRGRQIEEFQKHSVFSLVLSFGSENCFNAGDWYEDATYYDDVQKNLPDLFNDPSRITNITSKNEKGRYDEFIRITYEVGPISMYYDDVKDFYDSLKKTDGNFEWHLDKFIEYFCPPEENEEESENEPDDEDESEEIKLDPDDWEPEEDDLRESKSQKKLIIKVRL